MQVGRRPSSSSSHSERRSFTLQTPDNQPTVSGNLSNKNGKTIAIFLEARMSLLEQVNHEPFYYAYNVLEKTTNTVLVVLCLSKVESPIAEFSVNSTSARVVKETSDLLISSMNRFLLQFRSKLAERGVYLRIIVKLGTKSVDVVVETSNEIQPHWVILDSTFSPHEATLERTLDEEYNLVLIRNPPQEPKVIRWYLGPTKVRDGSTPEGNRSRASPSPSQRSEQWTPGPSITVSNTVVVQTTETNTTSIVRGNIFSCFYSADPTPSYPRPSNGRSCRPSFFRRKSSVQQVEARLEAQMAKTPSEYDGDKAFREPL